MTTDAMTRYLSAIMIIASVLLPAAAPSRLRTAIAGGISHAPSTDVTPIYEIQGVGASSPLVDAEVDTVGLVTGVTDNGFYLQDPVGDGNIDTSDGIYAFTYSEPTVRPGACVLVRGAQVQEYYGKTELSWIDSIESSGRCATNDIVPITLPPVRLGMNPAAQYERWEGMLVALDGLDGFVHGPTKRYATGEAEIAILPATLQPAVPHGRIFRTSDGDAEGEEENRPRAALYFLSSLLGGELPTANWGDRIQSGADGSDSLLAVLDYNFGKYQLLLLPGQTVFVEPGAFREEGAIAATADELSVCTANVHGLGRGSAQFPAADDYAQELDRRARMLADAMPGCTIIGVQETGAPADADSLAALLSRQSGLPYQALALSGPATYDGEFPLTNSFLVRTDRVQVTGLFSSQGCSPREYDVAEGGPDECPAGEYPLFNRPPLVLDVLVSGPWGSPLGLRVINNHWKSKAGDEQVNAVRRLLQAQHVGEIVEESLAVGENPNLIVLGDLNDFVDSEPIRHLSEQTPYPLVNIWDILPASDRYSYIFNGASQVLDHILISPNMVQLLSGAEALHVNADRGMAKDGTPQEAAQVSDHDPLSIRLRPEGAAAIGGDLAYPGVSVTLKHVDMGQHAETLTGVDGEYRIWDVSPGEVQIEYVAPGWLTVESLTASAVLTAGYTQLEGPTVRVESAQEAAASASKLLDTVSRQP